MYKLWGGVGVCWIFKGLHFLYCCALFYYYFLFGHDKINWTEFSFYWLFAFGHITNIWVHSSKIHWHLFIFFFSYLITKKLKVNLLTKILFSAKFGANLIFILAFEVSNWHLWVFGHNQIRVFQLTQTQKIPQFFFFFFFVFSIIFLTRSRKQRPIFK